MVQQIIQRDSKIFHLENQLGTATETLEDLKEELEIAKQQIVMFQAQNCDLQEFIQNEIVKDKDGMSFDSKSKVNDKLHLDFDALTKN